MKQTFSGLHNYDITGNWRTFVSASLIAMLNMPMNTLETHHALSLLLLQTGVTAPWYDLPPVLLFTVV